MALTSEEILRKQEQDPNFQRFGFSAPVIPPQGTENPLLFSSSEEKNTAEKDLASLATMEKQLEEGKTQLLMMKKTADELAAKEAETKKEEEAKAKEEASLIEALKEPAADTGETTAAAEKTQTEKDFETAQTELNSYKTQLQQYTVSDAQLASQIANIASQWDIRISDMKELNRRRETSLETRGIRIGAERYSASFGGILSAEEREGVQRIADLETQKQIAILAAQKAAKDQNWL